MGSISAAIVTALAAGLAGGVGDVGNKLIVDIYNELKKAMRRKFGKDSKVVESVEKLERKPDSEVLQEMLKKEVEAAKVAEDAKLRKLAEALLRALQETAEGQSAMRKYNITANNIGLVGDNVHIEGGIHFNNE